VRRYVVVAALLALLVACSSGSEPESGPYLVRLLKHKDRGQVGQRYLIANGKLPTGLDWYLIAYRREKGQLCVAHAWLEEKDNAEESTGYCPAVERPHRAIENDVSFQESGGEEQYLFGIVKDSGSPAKIRARRGDATQEIPLIRNEHFPGELFYIAHRDLPSLPETVELLDASGNLVLKLDYVWG
jgi:hypothetical protein